MNKRIRLIRKENKMSQEEFGKAIGIGKTSVSKLESGENNPSERTLMLICKEFNINENWLRTGTGEMKKDIDMDFSSICAEIGIKDEKAKAAIMKYYELSDDDKKLWWKFMEQFIK